MITCFETKIAGFVIRVQQASNKRFIVKYGEQIRTNLTYAQAASELGECIFHALACKGTLDNTA